MRLRGPAREGAETSPPLRNLSPSWRAGCRGLCPLGSFFSPEGLEGGWPQVGLDRDSRCLCRITSKWGHRTLHKATVPVGTLQLGTLSHDTPTRSQSAGTQAGGHVSDGHAAAAHQGTGMSWTPFPCTGTGGATLPQLRNLHRDASSRMATPRHCMGELSQPSTATAHSHLPTSPIPSRETQCPGHSKPTQYQWNGI